MRQLLLPCLAIFALLPLDIQAGDEDEFGQWDTLTSFGDNLFPAVIMATSTMKPDPDEEDPLLLGDWMGQIGAVVENPSPNARVRVVVEGQRLIGKSVFSGKMEKEGESYEIYPFLRYDYDSLLGIRQPVPELVSVSVEVNGEDWGTREMRLLFRSVNDCPFGAVDDDGEFTPLHSLFAAYVNENHPIVDQILGEALDSGDVNAFAGYQGDSDAVLAELEAVWNALKERGFAYSNITQSSFHDEQIFTQHVRLVGDSVRTSQANCVDGSVLIASIARKLGLSSFLVTIPGHMFVGVWLDDEEDEFACIETTMLGDAEFSDAVEAGNSQFKKHKKEILAEDSETVGYSLVDIEEARKNGILPLREPGAD